MMKDEREREKGRETYIRENLHQSSSQSKVAVFLEEGGGLSLVPDAAGTSDAMDVLLNVVREVVVDDMLHLRNVQASGSD